MRINIDKLMNVVIVVLCIILVVLSLSFVFYFKEASWEYEADEDRYMWYIDDELYNRLPELYYLRDYTKKYKGEHKECIAVAKYYKNASFYKMFDEVENDKKAEKHLALMNENINDMGDFVFTIDDINKKLDIEPVLR